MKEIILPPFFEGIHYRELSPKEGREKYKYITLEPITLCFKNRRLVPRDVKLQFNKIGGPKLMVINPYSITIFPGYMWNGCSPKLLLFKHWFGTPDFKETIIASLFHDALRQFESTAHFPFSRVTQDTIFFTILKEQNFKFATLYLFGVNVGSVILPKKSRRTVESLKLSADD